MSTPRPRSGIVLVQEGKVAVIERRRAGLLYYLFPGGGVEASESFEEAAVREAYEDLGLNVEIQQLLAVVDWPGGLQRYYLARATGGSFGTGTGPEFSSNMDPLKGSYRPTWLRISELDGCDVRPKSLALLLKNQQIDEIQMPVTLYD